MITVSKTLALWKATFYEEKKSKNFILTKNALLANFWQFSFIFSQMVLYRAMFVLPCVQYIKTSYLSYQSQGSDKISHKIYVFHTLK